MKTQRILRLNRRQFLCGTGASVAAFSILPRGVLHAAQSLPAYGRLNVAGIGIGSQGGADIDAVAAEGHNVVALCDVDDGYAAKKSAQYPNASQFKDYRVMHGSHGGGGCRLLPDRLMDPYSGQNAPAQEIPRVKNHAWDWAEAIRTGRQAGSHFGYGGPLTQAALLGAIAIRFPGQALRWDNTKAQFSNHDAANAYVHPEYRQGWSL